LKNKNVFLRKSKEQILRKKIKKEKKKKSKMLKINKKIMGMTQQKVEDQVSFPVIPSKF
jgi:hypothetical protein